MPSHPGNSRGCLRGRKEKKQSAASRLKKALKEAQGRVEKFLKYSDKYRLPFTHEEFCAQKKKSANKTRFERVCSELSSPNKPSRPFSAQYFDRDGKPLFFYFGVRWKDDLVSLCHF